MKSIETIKLLAPNSNNGGSLSTRPSIAGHQSVSLTLQTQAAELIAKRR